jgi:hypothetical protein
VTTPPTISESDLLAFIEDAPMSPDTARAVERAFQADPALAARCRARRRDRLALQRLTAAERAPAGAVARALAAAGSQRDVLARVTPAAAPNAAPVVHTIPVSRIGPVAEPWWHAAIHSPRLRPALAAAAVVAIVAGVGVLLYGAVSGRPQPPKPIASGNTPTQPQPGPAPTPVPVIADSTPGVTPPVPSPTPSDATPTVVAVAPAEQELTDDRLLELARSGRLAVRLNAPDAEQALRLLRVMQTRSRVLAVAPLSGIERSMILADLGQQRAIAQAAAAPAAPAPAAGLSPNGEPILAADGKPLLRSPVPSPAPVPVPSVPEPVFAEQAYVVHIPADAEALRQVLRWLSVDTSARTVSAAFVPLERSAVGGVAPAADAADVLWWTGPTSTWSPRITVPVIIQTSP